MLETKPGSCGRTANSAPSLTANIDAGDLNLGLHAPKNKSFSLLSSLSGPTYINLKTTQGQDSSAGKALAFTNTRT